MCLDHHSKHPGWCRSLQKLWNLLIFAGKAPGIGVQWCHRSLSLFPVLRKSCSFSHQYWTYQGKHPQTHTFIPLNILSTQLSEFREHRKTGLNHQHFNDQTAPGKYDMESPNKSLFQTVPIVAVSVQVLTIHYCMLHLLVDVDIPSSFPVIP